jgi:hypothetical protein
MHDLQALLAERISSGLKRRSVVSCSHWAETYRVMGKPFPGKWSFEHHPWARGIHDCKAELVIGEKAAQMAYTESALNKAFFHIDVKAESVLYILPAATPDAGDFSASRFDPALELSPHLQNLFSDVQNVGHKRAGSASLFIRGSRSRSQMKSLPVSLIIADEVDEMNQKNLTLAFERTSGQIDKQAFLLSTPTVENFGIDDYFKNSSQNHYFFKCPCCSKLTELTFPECLVITAETPNDPRIKDSHIICRECKGLLAQEQKPYYLKNGIWVPSYTDRLSEGFHISQLYSMTVKPQDLALSYLKAQLDATEEQEFFNSKLGKPHAVAGAKVSDADIHACMCDHKKTLVAPKSGIVCMGVDVGTWLHYEISQYFFDENYASDINLLSKARVINEGKLLHFEELDTLMVSLGIQFCVIDANPERRKAFEFASRFPGHVLTCFYGTSSGRIVSMHKEEERAITVDRTCWMDLALTRFRNRKIMLPADCSLEYKEHVKAPTRVYEKDQNGNPVGRYVTGNEADHMAHSRTYCEIALPFAVGMAQCQDVGGVY